MIRLAVYGLLIAQLSSGQSSSMASSTDGAILHFFSRRVLKDVPSELGRTYIYLHGNAPVLISDRAEGRTLGNLFVSSDGQTTAALSYSIPLGPSMFASPRGLLQVRRNGVDHDIYGQEFRLSRNGRYVLDTRYANFLPKPNVRDLDTGLTYEIPNVVARHLSQSVADNGAILTSGPGEISGFAGETGSRQVLYTPLGKTPELIYEGDNIYAAAIDAQASTAFVLTAIPGGKLIFRTFFKLIAIDLATRTRTVLYEGFADLANFTTSADGSRLLMQATDQLLLWDRGVGWRNLLSHDEHFREALLTDNGATVFAITNANRYLRIDANTGEATELYAPFPNTMRQSSFGAYPGSLIRFETDYSDFKLDFRIGDVALPKVRSEAGFFDVQIPWESDNLIGTAPIVEISSPDSPFLLRTQVSILDRPTPWVFTGGSSGYLTATNADFTALITPGNPAKTGSLIHFWVTGLGPLDRPIRTGEAGPTDPPASPTTPFACYLYSSKTNLPPVGLRIPTAIYAPNLIGVYQLDAEIPANWPSGDSEISCRGASFGGSTAKITVEGVN